jgi:hypothetical protein
MILAALLAIFLLSRAHCQKDLHLLLMMKSSVHLGYTTMTLLINAVATRAAPGMLNVVKVNVIVF